jgi:hypothetical protein
MDQRRVSDELEITALLNRYARAVDTKDWELYRGVHRRRRSRAFRN